MKNEYGESNANLNLNIEAEPEPEGEGPTFIEKPRIVSENSGKLVIMDCKVKANPRPDILWTRDGRPVMATSKVLMSMKEKIDLYYIKLELIEPGAEDSGLYKCNIKNTLGELNANLTLNIESECVCVFCRGLSHHTFRARSNSISPFFFCFLFLFHSHTRNQGQTENH